MIKLSIERKPICMITNINIFYNAKKKSIHNKCNKIALHYTLYLYTYIACFTIYKIVHPGKQSFAFFNFRLPTKAVVCSIEKKKKEKKSLYSNIPYIIIIRTTYFNLN